jgi:hypothetical protein
VRAYAAAATAALRYSKAREATRAIGSAVRANVKNKNRRRAVDTKNRMCARTDAINLHLFIVHFVSLE